MHLRPHCGRAGHAHHRAPLTLGAESTLDGTDSLVADGLTTLGDYDCTLAVPRLDADGGLDIPAIGVSLSIVGTALNNHADATWQMPRPGYNDLIYLDAGASINNLAGATFTVSWRRGRRRTPIEPGDSSAVAFNNAGTFIASTVHRRRATTSKSTSPSPTPAPSQLQQGTLNLSGTGCDAQHRLVHRRRRHQPGIRESGIRRQTSVLSSSGSVGLDDSAEDGRYSVAGDTGASNTALHGAGASSGPRWRPTGPSFAHARGGPVTLTAGS